MQVILKALCWTFLHSLWQGLLASLLAAVIISATKKTSARLRYNLLGTVLVLFLVTTLFCFQKQLSNQQELLTPASLVTGTISGPGYPVTGDLNSPAGFATDSTAWLNSNAGLLMLAWLFLFLMNCIKLFAGFATVRRLRYYNIKDVPAEWKTKLALLLNKIGIRQTVTLFQSGLVKVPVALGILKPVILVPIGLLSNIPPEQAEAILLHELAHIRRKDYLVNIIQRFVDAIFFFNPALLWMSSLLRQEREACCDDMVVTNTGQKRDYVNALVSFQEYSLNNATYAMAIGSRRHYLLHRVKRIMTSENKRLTLFETLSLVAGLILFSAYTVITKPEKKEKPLLTSVAVNRLATIYPAPAKKPQKNGSNITATPPAKKENKKPIRLSPPVTDTLPTKKDSIVLRIDDKIISPLPRETKWEDADGRAKKALKDIEKIKEKIAEKKSAIGLEKEKLKNPENKEEIKKRVEDNLKGKRKELERDRVELDRKRTEYEGYKKQIKKEKEAGKNGPPKKTMPSTGSPSPVKTPPPKQFVPGEKNILYSPIAPTSMKSPVVVL